MKTPSFVFVFVLMLAVAVALPGTLVSPDVAASNGKPGKVSGLTVVPYGSDAIYVAWGEPTTGGDPARFLVQARSVNGGPIHRKWVSSETMGHLFEGLDPGETYNVRVRAANAAGRGPLCVERVTLPEE